MSCPVCRYELASPIDLKNNTYKCWSCGNVYKVEPSIDLSVSKLKEASELQEKNMNSKINRK